MNVGAVVLSGLEAETTVMLGNTPAVACGCGRLTESDGGKWVWTENETVKVKSENPRVKM